MLQFKIISIVGALILLIGLGVYFYKTNTPLYTPTIIPTAKVSTEGWKTCKNEEYGYEFKYPNNWNLYNSEDYEDVKIYSGSIHQATTTTRCIKNVSVSSFTQTGGPWGLPPENEQGNFFSVEVEPPFVKASTTIELIQKNKEIISITNKTIPKESHQSINHTANYILNGVKFFAVQSYNYKNEPIYLRLFLLTNNPESLFIIRTSDSTTPSKIPAVNETILSTFRII